MINLDGTTVSFKSSASQKRRSKLERTEANYTFFFNNNILNRAWLHVLNNSGF